MTPAEEVSRLNKLIHQYETVFRTTSDLAQRDRVERQLKDLRAQRETILAVHVIQDEELAEPGVDPDPLRRAPLLKGIAERNAVLPPAQAVPTFAELDTTPTSTQLEMFHLALYLRFFEREYLPFLTEKQLKLDYKYSMDRDGFYTAFQAISRRMVEYGVENGHALEAPATREAGLKARDRAGKVSRLVQTEAARLFRSIQRFCEDLEDDAHGDMVKCLNCNGVISFDSIEGVRILQGRTVGGALRDLKVFAEEAVLYLNVPET